MQFGESLRFRAPHPSSGPLEEDHERSQMLVWSRMDAWEAGRYCALVKEVEECAMEDGFPHAHTDRSLELESVG